MFDLRPSAVKMDQLIISGISFDYRKNLWKITGFEIRGRIRFGYVRGYVWDRFVKKF